MNNNKLNDELDTDLIALDFNEANKDRRVSLNARFSISRVK